MTSHWLVKTRFLTLIFASSLLVACGGGGGGGGSTSGSGNGGGSPANDVPVAQADSFNTSKNSAVTYDLLANDSGLGDALISVSITNAPGNGTITNDGDGTITYTPNAEYVGTESFTYMVTDGDNETDSANVTVSVVDSAAVCTLTSVLCVGPGEEYNTNIQNVETAFQNAADAANPGDVIKIRGGTYQHDESSSPTTTFLKVTVSGTGAQPITIEPFDNEKVLIKGFGFSEGTADPNRKDEILIQVTGNYIHIRNLELSDATRHGLDVSGKFGIFEDLVVHDSWFSNVTIGRENRQVEGNIVRYVESYRSRHGNGFTFSRRSSHNQLLIGNRIENTISYNNGYQPDGQKVPAIAGDPAGGGNSDAYGSSKMCHDLAGALGLINLCPDNVLKGNIGWHNADDGFDNSFGDGSIIEGNISFDNGPEGRKGFKGLRNINGGVTYLGNIAVGNDDRGFEPRFTEEGYLYHNLAMGHSGQGIILDVNFPDFTRMHVYNNLSALNDSPDMVLPGGADIRTNWAEDSDGNPQLMNVSFDSSSIDTNYLSSLTNADKLEFIRSQFRAALTPQAGSPLIDAGTFVAGVHCTTADDDQQNPMPLSADCRHWSGNAPDIGVYEYQ